MARRQDAAGYGRQDARHYKPAATLECARELRFNFYCRTAQPQLMSAPLAGYWRRAAQH